MRFSELELKQILKLFSNIDIIIIEGYHNNEYPKIEVHRKSVCNRLLYESNACGGIISIASDENLKTDCEVLDINDGTVSPNGLLKRLKNF